MNYYLVRSASLAAIKTSQRQLLCFVVQSRILDHVRKYTVHAEVPWRAGEVMVNASNLGMETSQGTGVGYSFALPLPVALVLERYGA